MTRDEAIEYAFQRAGWMSSDKPGHDPKWVAEKIELFKKALDEKGWAVEAGPARDGK